MFSTLLEPFCFIRFAWISLTAALIASSANMLQWSFTGGRLRCLAISLFLMVSTSSIDLPFTLQIYEDTQVCADMILENCSCTFTREKEVLKLTIPLPHC